VAGEHDCCVVIDKRAGLGKRELFPCLLLSLQTGAADSEEGEGCGRGLESGSLMGCRRPVVGFGFHGPGTDGAEGG
jgi:hypothetical protein